MAVTLYEILALLKDQRSEAQDEIIRVAREATQHMLWVPNPGPQTDARNSLADELFYGGEAGGGKTDLIIGLALTDHRRSLILRRTNKEALGLVERMTNVVGSRDGWNSQQGAWRLPEGRVVEIGGCEHEDDKQKRKGTPHDLKAFDEISDFTESQYTFIIAWNRSTEKGQRCRVVGAGNPPTKPEGQWVLRRWGAWLDPQHPNPAKPGELRWYTTGEEGEDLEVDGRGPHEVGGQYVYARSRTFIPATLDDNPDLAATEYASVLAALPPELRAAYRDGNFQAGLEDDAYQAIPTAWVKAAQARWTPTPPPGTPLSCIGVDVAQGGGDRTVIARRHNFWFAPIIAVKGKDTPDGKVVSGLVIQHRRDSAPVVVDLGGGWGGDAYGHLKENGVEAYGYLGVKKSVRRTVDNLLQFSNVRTESYWRFREALDPSQPNGSMIALPASTQLVADLCAPRYHIKGSASRNGVIELESKADVCKRLGRSTDEGDATIMAWWKGLTHVNMAGAVFPSKDSLRPRTADMGLRHIKDRRR